jgi:hypothetical protein
MALLYVSSNNPAQGTCLAVYRDRLVAGEASFLQVVDPTRVLRQRVPLT